MDPIIIAIVIFFISLLLLMIYNKYLEYSDKTNQTKFEFPSIIIPIILSTIGWLIFGLNKDFNEIKETIELPKDSISDNPYLIQTLVNPEFREIANNIKLPTKQQLIDNM